MEPTTSLRLPNPSSYPVDHPPPTVPDVKEQRQAMREVALKILAIAFFILLPIIIGIGTFVIVRRTPCTHSSDQPCWEWNGKSVSLLALCVAVSDFVIAAAGFFFARPDITWQHATQANRKRNWLLLLNSETLADAEAAHRTVRRGWLPRWPRDDRDLHWLNEYGYCDFGLSQKVIDLVLDTRCLPGREIIDENRWKPVRNQLNQQLPYNVYSGEEDLPNEA